jgi:hypothetical protein
MDSLVSRKQINMVLTFDFDIYTFLVLEILDFPL